MITRDCEGLADLLPAHALDALRGGEEQQVERHVEACQECAAEVASYLEVAAAIALGLPQHQPPATLGRRTLAAARADLERPARAPWGGLTSGGFGHLAAWWQGASPRLAAGLAAAAAVALVWGATLQQQLWQAETRATQAQEQLERVRQNYQTVAAVLASTETRVRDLEAAQGLAEARGRVWVDARSGRGMLMATGLPPADPAHTYQVWLMRGEERVSAGFLRSSDDGVYYTVLQAPGRLTEYQRLGVTLEPAGGSPGPTTPRLIGGEI